MSRGEERRHNYVIITLANTRDVKNKKNKQVMRRQRRRHSKVFILSADLHKAKRQEVELSQLSVRITGAQSQPALCVTVTQHSTMSSPNLTDKKVAVGKTDPTHEWANFLTGGPKWVLKSECLQKQQINGVFM